jgi:hypothetical protein
MSLRLSAVHRLELALGWWSALVAGSSLGIAIAANRLAVCHSTGTAGLQREACLTEARPARPTRRPLWSGPLSC